MIKYCKICQEPFQTKRHGEKRIYCFLCSPPGTSNSITHLRRRAKQIAIKTLGSKCLKCGQTAEYLLDFHHRNPDEKDGELADFSKGYDLTKFFEELDKCDLLCTYCHREYHHFNETAGLTYEEFLSPQYELKSHRIFYEH